MPALDRTGNRDGLLSRYAEDDVERVHEGALRHFMMEHRPPPLAADVAVRPDEIVAEAETRLARGEKSR